MGLFIKHAGRIFLFGTLSVVSSPSWGTTLEQFLTEVKTSNPSLQASRLRAGSEKSRAAAAGVWDDPFFAVGVDEVPKDKSDEGVIRYQLSQAVPFPGRLSARKEAASMRAAAVEADASTSERQFVVSAIQSFSRAIYTKRSIETNRRVRAVIQTTAESSKARYQTGGVGHHEYLLARVEMAALDAENLRLERELKTLKANLNELRARPLDEPIDPEPFTIPASEPLRAEEAIASQPEFLGAKALSQAAGADRKAARLTYFPDFVLQGMYMTPRMGAAMEEEGGMGETSNWGAMVGISIPLFFFAKQTNLSEAATADREAASAQVRALENRLQREWLEANEQLKTAEDLVKLYKADVIPNTELAAANARSAYAARKLPLSQLLDVLRSQRTQELELLAAEIDVEMAKVRRKFLLSSPPQFRLAPMRPTLFGGEGMGGGMQDGMSSGSVNMGGGVSNPAVGPGNSKRKEGNGGAGGMSGMGGM